MPDLSVNRTLVKSPPELWSEVSEVESLARHLGEFGEVTISRLHPEHTVAWEGRNARGTVELEASGWGTKVTLSAELDGPPRRRRTDRIEPAEADAPGQDEPEPVVDEAPRHEPPAPLESAPELSVRASRRESWLRRWFFRNRRGGGQPAAGPGTLEFEPVDAEPLAWYEPDPIAPDAFELDPFEPDPAPEPIPEPEPEPEAGIPDQEPAIDTNRARMALEGALASLGSAHHRPFSRG